MRKSVLVTGAGGLLGANICKLAAEQGRRVLALVRHEGDAAVLKPFGVQTDLGDLGDVERLAAGMKSMEGVIHTAALVGGTWATATPEEFDDSNYGGVLRVLDAARRAGVARTLARQQCRIHRRHPDHDREISNSGHFRWRLTL